MLPMMVVELTTVPSAALPVALFRQHLRLGTGFAEDSLQDAVLDNLLRAALAAVEGRTGKALIRRGFVWTLTRWSDAECQPLPLAPVVAIDALRLFSRTGSETVVEPAAYRLVRDTHRPLLQPTAMVLPTIDQGGMVEIELEAGYGEAWAEVPADLGQAVLLLAAHYYEHRNDATDAKLTQLPYGVTALLERFRNLRVGRGGAT
jgi:uncharacterized phiE125 gp8 family phage protein